MGANNLPGGDSNDTEVEKVHLIFTGHYKEIISSDFLQIGFVLRQQCDINILYTYFPSGFYLMQVTEMTTAQEREWHMKCVVFLLMEKHRKHLHKRHGRCV